MADLLSDLGRRMRSSLVLVKNYSDSPNSFARTGSMMSVRAGPSRHATGIPVSPQHAPANCPQTAPVVSASSHGLTAVRTASLKSSAP